jgi:hypothetical protein
MAAKTKQIKTENEYNILTKKDALGNKVGVAIFYNGKDASAFKTQLSDLNDLAGDFFEEASFIAVDVRFFPNILAQHPGAAEGKASIFKVDGQKALVDSDCASIKDAVNKHK